MTSKIRGPLSPSPKRRPAVLATSIAALLAWGFSSSALKADTIIIGAGAGGSPQVTLVDPITLETQSTFNALTTVGGAAVAAGDGLIVVGAANGGGTVNVYDASTLTLIQTLNPFGNAFTNGVSVAIGDGKLVVGTGAGGGSQVSVYSDTTFAMPTTFTAFDSGFTGGVNVAVGGGKLLVGEASAGSQIRLYNDSTLGFQSTLNPFTSFTGGATVAIGDGIIVAGQGAGGTASVDVYDASTLGIQVILNPFDSSFKGGANVAVGNGRIIAATGAGGPSGVFLFDSSTYALQNSFAPFAPTFTGGVTVAVLPVLQTWTGATNGDWNTGTNWNPAGVPNSPDAIAVFDVSNRTAVSISANTEVNGLTFTANATVNSYTITINPDVALTLSGTGITNSSGITQTLVTDVDGSGHAGSLVFRNGATAGSSAITNQGTTSGGSSGTTYFNDVSSAGVATILNQAGSGNAGGATVFNGGSAGGATIINRGGNGSATFGGVTIFNSGSGGHAFITANGAINGGATSGGQIIFNGGTAEEAILTANGGSVDSAPGGVITFNSATASSATIAINGGSTANAGGGAIYFKGDSSGGVAVATVAAGGVFDISGLTTDGMSIGAIAGAGRFNLGSNRLTVGSEDGFGTTVSGVIADGGQAGGTGGSLFASGSGSLTLTGQNTYTGITGVINGGTLNANTVGALPAPAADGGTGTARAELRMDLIGSGYSTLNLGARQAVSSLIGASTSTINLNGHILTAGTNDSSTSAFAGSITDGTGLPGFSGLTTDGTGTLILSGFNTYTGATLISGANTLVVGDGNGGNLAGTSGVTVAGGATLAINLASGATFGAAVSLNGDVFNASNLNAIQSGTNTLAGGISGTGIVSQSGSGTTILTGANTYSGATFVNAGNLRLGTNVTAGSIANTSVVVVGDGANFTIVNVAGGTFDRDIDNLNGGAGTVTIFSANAVTVSGQLQNSSGTLALVKNGPGTAILSGQNSYTGSTTVNAGILEVDNLIHSTVTVNMSAALRGNGTINGDIHILSGGTYLPQGDTTVITGNLSLQAGANISVRLGATGIQDEELVGGNLTLAGTVTLVPQSGFGVGTYPLFGYAGTLDMGKVAINSVPGYTTKLTSTPAPGGNVLNIVITAPAALPTLGWDGSGAAGNGSVDGGSGTWDTSTANWTNTSGTTNSAWANGTAVFANTPGTVTLGSAISAQGLLFAAGGYTISSLTAKLTLTAPASFVTVAQAGQVDTIDAPIVSVGQFIANGPGTLVLAGPFNAISGRLDVITGTLVVGTPARAATLGSPSEVVLSDGGTLRLVNLFNNSFTPSVIAGLGQTGTIEIASATPVTLAHPLSDNTPGQLALTVDLGATAILTNTLNTFTGATKILGTVQVGTATVNGSLGPNSPVIFLGNGALALLNPSGDVFANSITNQSNGTPTVLLNTNHITVAGSLVDSGGGALTLTKENSGLAVLTGSNSYFGATTVNAGTLQIGDGMTFGSAIANSAVKVNGTGILALNLLGLASFENLVGLLSPTASLVTLQSGTTALTGRISGDGTFTQRGMGTTIVTRQDSYIGPTAVSAGTLQIGNAISGNLTDTSKITVSGSGTLALDLATKETFSRVIILSSAGSSLKAIAPGFNTFSETISGAGSFVQNGLGTTELTVDESYTGATTVNAGLLIVDRALAAKTLVTVNGGTFQLDGTLPSLNTVRVATAGTLAGAGNIHGSVTVNGNGVIDLAGGTIIGPLTFTGGNWNGEGTVTGAVTASGASTNIFTIGKGAQLIAPEGLSVIGGQLAGTGELAGDLTYASAAASTFRGLIGSGAVAMKKAGATLTLTGANFYDGGTTVSAGTLQVGEGGVAEPSFFPLAQLGTGPVTVSGKGVLAVDLRDQAAFTSTVDLTAATATLKAIQAGTTSFNGTISGAGGFLQAGTGTSVLASNGSGLYSGDTTIFSGTLDVEVALPHSTVHVGTAGTLTGNSAALNKVTLTGNGVIDFGSANSTITGGLTVTGGHWMGNGSVAAAVTASSGNFSLEGTLSTTTGLMVTGGTLSGAGTLIGNLTYQSSADSTFDGVITLLSAVKMNKPGAMLTLSGNNTYLGPTTVNLGTLNVTGSLTNSTVTVNNVGTLSGTGTIAGHVTVRPGGTFAPGDDGTPGNFTIGNLEIDPGAKLKYVLGASGATAAGNNDLAIVNGPVSVDGTLSITAGFGFGAGTYLLMQATSPITLGTVNIGLIPAGFTKAEFNVRAVGNQLQLVVTGGPVVQYWNPSGASGIHGGSGPWDNTHQTWSNAAGTATTAWASSTAVFSSGSGTVTAVDKLTVAALGFVPGAGVYTLAVGPQTGLSITGAGITNTSGVAQSIVTSATNAGVGAVEFLNSATAGNINITNQGTAFNIASSGGVTRFMDKSSAGGAIITNLAGTVHGGGTYFTEFSDGGTAQVINTGNNSFLDISGLTSKGMNLGSIAGGGFFALGSKMLTVGGNDLSTVVSGIIADGSFGQPNNGAKGMLTKTGAGTLTLTGANTYTGATMVKSGALQLGDGVSTQAALQSSLVTVAPGAMLALNLANGGNFAVKITDNGNVTLAGTTGVNFTVGSAIGGSGKLLKTGSDSVTLTGQSPYSGGTTINAGALIAANAVSSTGPGPVAINNGGALGGGGKVAGATTLNNGGTVAPGLAAIGTPGTTLHGGSLLWNPGSTLTLQLGGTVNDALALSGALNKGSLGAGAFTIDIERTAAVTPGNYTLATFSSSSFSAIDFTLDLPNDLTGHLVKNAKSLVLDITGESSQLILVPNEEHLLAAESEEPLPTEGDEVVATDSVPPDAPDAGAVAAEASSLPASVPEPATATLLAFAGATLLAKRRRKS